MYSSDFVMLCNKYKEDTTWPRGEDKIRIFKRACNVLFIIFEEKLNLTLILDVSVITKKFGPNTARVCMGYPW